MTSTEAGLVKGRTHPTLRRLLLAAACTTPLLATASADQPRSGFAKVTIIDPARSSVLARSQGDDVEIPRADEIVLRVTPRAGKRSGRIRLEATAGSPAGCVILPSGKRHHDDKRSPFIFRVSAAETCSWKLTGWRSATNWRKTGTIPKLTIKVPEKEDAEPAGKSAPAPKPKPAPAPTSKPAPQNEPPASQQARWDVTQGTTGSASFDVGPKGSRNHHGVRLYCPVSHFAYDDPIVLPGQSGAAHLHMFIGNTSADADSTLNSLEAAGRTSCEGGRNNLSSYWLPALFNADREVVLPETVIIYYKTFMHGRTPDVLDPTILNPIPQGLEMLSSPDTKNGAAWVARTESTGKGKVRLALDFPQCVAVDARGRPVLRYRDMPAPANQKVNSHVAYQSGAARTANDCPRSHPYRIPGLSMKVRYDVDMASAWSLASDKPGQGKGRSLHADYVAVWDAGVRDDIVRCNAQSRSCEFRERQGTKSIGRGQLRERFLAPDGTEVYRYSSKLAPGRDRTPFGSKLTPMRGGSAHRH